MTVTKTADRGVITLQHGTTGSQRVRYYNGMLLDEKDLESEQQYQNAARQELARLMLGYGIIEGLTTDESEPKCLRISPGSAVDSRGRLIRVDAKIEICAKTLCAGQAGGTHCCEDDALEGGDIVPDRIYCLMLQYEERRCEPPAPRGKSKGCSPAPEMARIAEGWRLVLLEDGCCPVRPCCEGVAGAELCSTLRDVCTDDAADREKLCCGVALARIRVVCKDTPAVTIVADDKGTVRRYSWTARRLDRLFAALCAAACAPRVQLADSSAEPTASSGDVTKGKSPRSATI